ncbi:hypothetical protein AAZX31_11G123200 [Glycine max]
MRSKMGSKPQTMIQSSEDSNQKLIVPKILSSTKTPKSETFHRQANPRSATTIKKCRIAGSNSSVFTYKLSASSPKQTWTTTPSQKFQVVCWSMMSATMEISSAWSGLMRSSIGV